MMECIEPFNVDNVLTNLKMVYKKKDIEKLSEESYGFINVLSGFYDYWDIDDFKEEYTDLRRLIETFEESADISNPEYYEQEYFTMPERKKFYESIVKILKAIPKLIEEVSKEVYDHFDKKEKDEDVAEINRLIHKHGLSIGVKEAETEKAGVQCEHSR